MIYSMVEKYQKEWNILLGNISAIDSFEDKPTNPLLLDIPTAYFEADCKVMIFGQETNDWEGSFPHEKGIEHLLVVYRQFFLSGHCYSYGGQFWNGVSQIRNALSEKLKTAGKEINVIWNNLIKIGKESEIGTPCEDILRWEDNWFDVVLFEVRELKPDIVIFFSGPDYDEYINRIFSDASFESINKRSERQLARVKSCELPNESIRAYHPSYFLRKRKMFYGYLDEIVGALCC